MESFTFSALPTANGHLFQWKICLLTIGEWNEAYIKFASFDGVIMSAVKLNWTAREGETWKGI